MARIETWYKQDLQNLVKVQWIDGNLFSQDNEGNLIGVEVYRNGEAEAVSGTVSGNFVRADGTTVAIVGVSDGNRAYVIIPAAAYAVPGSFSLAIKVTADETVTTLAAVSGIIYRSTTDTAVDPGTIIEDIQALIDAIETAVDSIPADYSSLWTSLAPAFSTSASYTKGQYVTYNGAVYRFTADHAGTWASGDVTAVTLGGAIAAETAERKLSDEEAAYGNIEFVADQVGYYVNSYGVVASNNNLRCSDFVPIPANAIGFKAYVIYSGTSTFSPAAALYDENKTFLMSCPSTGHVGGYKTFTIPSNAKYIRFNQAKKPGTGTHELSWIMYGAQDNMDCIGVETLSATSSTKMSAHGWILLKAGVGYKLVTPFTPAQTRNRFFLYQISESAIDMTYYVDITKYNGEVSILPKKDSYLCFYNVDSLASISVTVYVYEYKDFPVTYTPRTYYVSKNTSLWAGYTYKSLTQCLLDLKDDENEKTIIIDGGDYDIVQEYADAGVPAYTGDNPTYDYYDCCVWVPKNTHIIGRGIVRLLWMPDYGDITVNQSKTVSPLNVAESCTIENIEVHCKNGRYCLHNDGLSNLKFIGAIQRYKNVRFYKYANDEGYGFQQTIGFGISARMTHEYDGCEFHNENSSPAFYGHARAVVGGATIAGEDSPTIILKNCILDAEGSYAARLDNTSGANAQRIRTSFESCYLSGAVRINDSESNLNVFDVTFLNCNDPTVTGGTTRYPAKIYPPVE